MQAGLLNYITPDEIIDPTHRTDQYVDPVVAGTPIQHNHAPNMSIELYSSTPIRHGTSANISVISEHRLDSA